MKIDRSLLSTKFAAAPVEDLSEGIRPSLSVLSIKGNAFTIRRNKTYIPLPAAQRQEIELIILRGAQYQSKQFYAEGYRDGADDRPICWSSDGRVPDQNVEEPQAQSCGMCSHNILKKLPSGFQGKECGDRKRLAVVPANNVLNQEYGGPMLFSVPPASLSELEKYGVEFKRANTPYYSYTTIVRFKAGTTGKLEFEVGRPVTDEEADAVIMFRESEGGKERLAFILNEITPDETEQKVLTSTDTKPRVTPGVSALPRAEPPQQEAFAATSKPKVTVHKEGPIGQALQEPATPPVSTRTVKVPEEVTSTGIDDIDEMFGALIKE